MDGFPVAKAAVNEVDSLPMHLFVSDEEQCQVVDALARNLRTVT